MATGNPVAAGGDLDREGKLPLIAVIAVHGVADQAPNESARQIAELLLRNRHDGGASRYSSFREYPLRIPVDQPIDSCPDKACPVDTRIARDADRGSSVVDLDFTHFLLHRYKTKYAPYETVRLEGHRLKKPGPAQDQGAWIESDQCHVHVYELFWADLSRLGTGLVGFVGAIYQLISSLAHLGIRTIRQARQREDPDDNSKLWSAYFRIHDVATWLLTVVVPFLNLAMLGAALAMLVARIPRGLQALVMAALAIVLLVVARTRWRLRARVKVPDDNARHTNKASAFLKSVWSMGPSFVWLAIAAAAAFLLHQYLTRPANDVAALRLTVIVWIAVMVFLLVTLGRIYNERISSALPVSLVVSGLTAVLLLVFTLGSRDVVQVARGAVSTIELIFLLLTLVWILVTLGGIGSAIAAALVVLFATTDRKAVLRAMWTGASTFAVSTATLSALALVTWSALYAVLERSLPAPSAYSLRPVPAARAYDPAWQPPTERTVTRDTSYHYGSRVRHVLLADQARQLCFDPNTTLIATPSSATARVVECRDFSLKSMLRTLLSVSAMTGLFLNGIALGLTSVIGLWLAFPSILRELKPADAPGKTDHKASMAAGLWLTQGFRQLRRAAVGVYALVFLGTGFVIALALWIFWQGTGSDGWPVSVLEFILPYSDAFVFGIGSLVAASTVGVLALLSRFGRLANMFRPVVDVSLDVDNYLKSRPVRRTPRARMMERFVSLLRYITRWRRNGAGYDAIIVVAHSQGSVLTSDLLRYQATPDRQFKDLSLNQGYTYQVEPEVQACALRAVDFFTMGSPLRQLYTSSFPHLFHWTALTSDNDDSARRLCSSLGVRRWWNVFRSGDYVGRALWQYGGAASAYAPGRQFAKGDACLEVCLGLGAHTHYWDESAGDDVALHLDKLVELAYDASPRKPVVP